MAMIGSEWDYLSTGILTSPPQKLHLLLLEGAVRFVRRTELAWENGSLEEGYQYLERARAIVGELLAGIKKEVCPELTEYVAALYRFVYTALAEAGLTQNVARLREAARILEMDRDTWREVCQILGGQAPNSQADISAGTEADSTPVSSQASRTVGTIVHEGEPAGGGGSSFVPGRSLSGASHHLDLSDSGPGTKAGGSASHSVAPAVPSSAGVTPVASSPSLVKRQGNSEAPPLKFMAEA
jgi:flagellar protein FliS